MVDLSKYVVLDVETNGLSPIHYDLLSISIYKPDDGKIYNRYLPLEKNDDLFEYEINGITMEMIEGQQPLTQEEVDQIISDFELESRTVLTYGDIDKRFLKHYFLQHSLKNLDKFVFFNFKQRIFSSKFSSGNITKDNLCKLLNIENVTEVHSGSNDCILEWKLFEAMDEDNFIVIENDVFRMSDQYYLPISYICNFPNLMRKVKPSLPEIYCTYETVVSVPCSADAVRTNELNGGGMILEHLINTRLSATPYDDKGFLGDNKSILKYIGTLPSNEIIIPIFFNKNGTVTALNKRDQNEANELNRKIDEIGKTIQPLLDYLQTYVFHGEIYTQELVINEDKKILARCDLSDKNSVVEIKGHLNLDIDKIKYQLYYECNNRQGYILFYEKGKLKLAKVSFCTKEVFDKFAGAIKNDRLSTEREQLNEKLANKKVTIVEYKGKDCLAKLRCEKCNKIFQTRLEIIRWIECPYCHVSKEPRKWEHIDLDRRYNLICNLSLREMEIVNWISKNEIIVRCKKCKKIFCNRYQNLIKPTLHCECEKVL